MEEFAGNNEAYRTQKYILEVLLDIRELLQKQNEAPHITLKMRDTGEERKIFGSSEFPKSEKVEY